MSTVDDFGFSLSDDDILQSDFACKEKLKKVEDLILPLLLNLKKNPENEFIRWPNRGPAIDEQIKKITDITRS